MKRTSLAALSLLVAFTFPIAGPAQAQTTPSRSVAPATPNPAQSGAPATASTAPLPPPVVQPPPPAASAPVQLVAPTVTAVPGQPYVIVDPATGQRVPVITYGPVVRQRPAELPYIEGSPVPRGYTLQEYHPRGLIIGGAVTLGVLYLISFSVASSNNFDNANGWLAVPVIGPFGWLAARKTPACDSSVSPYTCSSSDESSNRTMVALDGMGQVAGAAMLIAGLAITKKRLILVDQDVVVAPYASSTGSGLRVMGRF